MKTNSAILILLLIIVSGIRPMNAGAQTGANASDYTHSRLLCYKDTAGVEHPVKTVEEWEQRRQAILTGMQAVMGLLPDLNKKTPPAIKIHGKEQFDDFERLKISLQVETGHRLFAFLFKPVQAGKTMPQAAILALHPTHSAGKGDTAGLTGRKNRSYGLELAQRGYVVLVPDYPSFGDDAAWDFDNDRYVSGTMKGIFNHIRCVDYLCSLDYVDPNRLGVIGHSLGGHNAMFVGVFEPRLNVIISSCGWTPFHDYYGGKIKGWTSARYMPRLKDIYQLDPDRVPFDFYEVVAALAPRAFFSNSPLHDSNFDVNGVKKVIPRARKVYRLFQAESLLQVRYPDDEHDFPPAIRREAYQFMDQILQHRPLHEIP